MPPTRRRFILGVAALIPLPAVGRRFHALAVRSLDSELLRSVAYAVLPFELGKTATDRAAADFERWLAEYREGAELLHGYGTGEIQRTGPSPAVRWAAQLRALDTAARKGSDRSFITHSRPGRQELIRSALAGYAPGGLPIDRAPHIALGLLAHFYSSSAAQDLCYRARIGKETCRPLSGSAQRPLPLAPRS